MQIAHVRNDKIIKTYNEGKGRVILENGDTVSPPVVGYTNGNDKLLPIVIEEVDNSASQSTTRSMVETIEADRVVRVTTISDRTVEQWREIASLPRRDFCLSLFAAGILSKDDTILASQGGWPTVFDNFMAGKTDAEIVAAQVEWASAQNIRRLHPMIGQLADLANLSPEQVDAIFGWKG